MVSLDGKIMWRQCWCCGNSFNTDWRRFKEHIDECELKVIENPDKYDEKENGCL